MLLSWNDGTSNCTPIICHLWHTECSALMAAFSVSPEKHRMHIAFYTHAQISVLGRAWVSPTLAGLHCKTRTFQICTRDKDMSWISGAYECRLCMALTWNKLNCCAWFDSPLWAACPCLSYMVRSCYAWINLSRLRSRFLSCQHCTLHIVGSPTSMQTLFSIVKMCQVFPWAFLLS